MTLQQQNKFHYQ